MKLFCIGCGPGDPDLLTLKAINLIQDAEVIFVPTSKPNKESMALSIAKKFIMSKTQIKNLIFPMVKNRDSLQDQWKYNAEEIAKVVREGKRTIYLTVGDPSLYSTWIYIHREIRKNHRDLVQVVL